MTWDKAGASVVLAFGLVFYPRFTKIIMLVAAFLRTNYSLSNKQLLERFSHCFRVEHLLWPENRCNRSSRKFALREFILPTTLKLAAQLKSRSFLSLWEFWEISLDSRWKLYRAWRNGSLSKSLRTTSMKFWKR